MHTHIYPQRGRSDNKHSLIKHDKCLIRCKYCLTKALYILFYVGWMGKVGLPNTKVLSYCNSEYYIEGLVQNYCNS